MENKNGYLYALDGIRALALLLIFNFHLWQQSWITYKITICGKTILDFYIWQRFGYIAIDIFFVISGFGLFYPVAREMFGETAHISWKRFYIKRAKRILPGYYFMLIVLMIFPALSYGISGASPVSEIIKHYGLHALFLHIYNNSTSGTVISTAWTLGIEAAFYLVFPFIASIFRKKPAAAFAGMFVLEQGIRLYMAARLQLTLAVMNFPLAYIDIFGIGMLSAYFTVAARHKLKMDRLKVFMTVLSMLFISVIYYYAKWLSGAKTDGVDGAAYQRLLYRFILAWASAGLIFTSVYSVRLWSRVILGNKVFLFLSSISYSFFLWHQNINIFLKRFNIPHSDMNPVMNDRPAMIVYSILSLALSLAISIFSTYVIEKPFLKSGKQEWKGTKKWKNERK